MRGVVRLEGRGDRRDVHTVQGQRPSDVEARAGLRFDRGGPPGEVGVAEMAADAQVGNCNGV